jgi:transketolase
VSILPRASAGAVAQARRAWNELFGAYRAKHPSLALEIEQMQKRVLPDGWDRNLPVFPADAKGIAGRDASGQVLNVLAQNILVHGWLGDLGPSNKTTLKFDRRRRLRARDAHRQELPFRHSRARHGRGGQRDVAVEAAPVSARRSSFSATTRAARFRLSALMELPTLMVFTHDAMGDGEMARRTSRSSTSRRCGRYLA